MSDEESADGGRGFDSIVTVQRNVQSLLSVEAIHDDALQRMVWAGGITEGSADDPPRSIDLSLQPLCRSLRQSGTDSMCHQSLGLISGLLFRTRHDGKHS